MKSPQSGDRLAVHNLEDPPVPVQPLDVPGTVGGRLEEAQQELPQVRVVIILGSPLDNPGCLVWLYRLAWLRYSVMLVTVVMVRRNTGEMIQVLLNWPGKGRTRTEVRKVWR